MLRMPSRPSRRAGGAVGVEDVASRLGVLGIVLALMTASVLLFAAPSGTAGTQPRSGAGVAPSAVTPSIWYNYSDFFNVPYGEWWDMRTPLYGDEPVKADCFNATAASDGTCTTNVAGLSRVAQYPYMDWAGSGNTKDEGSVTSMYAPYRADITAYNVGGYNLSQPVFLPVLNYNAAPGTQLSFNWYMQYLDKANFTKVTSTLGCYGGTGATANEGYQLWNKIYLTMDNEEAARLFGATVSTSLTTMQNWWSTNTLPGCSGSHSQFGPLESSVNSWFQNEANGKYDIFNGYDAAYESLYTNITATVVSPGPTGTTNVYIEHGAWGTEILLDRWFYWGNATYAGNQLDSSKAAGWWGMENGWWEDVHYTGSLTSADMNFNLKGVLQYHFQEHSAPGADGCLRQQTGCTEAVPSDDTPYWTWGPMLVDYVFPASNGGPYSEMDRFAGLNYIKTTPGSGDYGKNTSFDYTPISWAAKAGEWWNFQFPTTASAYYQNPATAPIGTDPLKSAQLPTITSTLSLQKIFPAPYGTWNAAAGAWSVTGGTAESWPASTGPGTYPYVPFPGIYLQPSNLPPGVTTTPATGITGTGATLNGNLASLGSATSVDVGFRWGTDATLATATNVTVGPLTSPGAFNTALTGLTLGVTYYFQAWANGVGFAHGSIMSFNTAGTPPTVATVAASGITASAATLNGDLAGLGTASSVTVGFLHGTDPGLAGATNDTVGTETAAGPFADPLSGLTAGTTYYFQAWADGDGFAEGTILSFTTGTTYPQVTTDPASAVITTGANLNGHTTSLGTATSVDVGFLYGTDSALAGATNVTASTQTVPGAFTEAVTGLTPGTTYYFQAWANGNGFAAGSILSFTTGTPPTSPPSVTTDAATGITMTGATLNGATTSLGTAGAVDVGFLYGTDSALAGATNTTVGPQTAAGPFSLPLTGLASATTYYFQAWALGDGFAAGSILSFTTASPPSPPVVTTSAASGVTASGATLNGATSSLGSATSVSVGFLYGTDSALAGATNVTASTQAAPGSFSTALTGLTAATTYYFRAWANGDGFATGTIQSFTTTSPASVSPPSATTSAASSVTTTGATLNGNLAGLGSASSVTVGFLWGTSATLSGATNVTVGAQTATGTFTSALTGLSPGTTYYVEAWALGDGFAHGTILSFTTGASGAAPPEPTFLGLPAMVGYAVLAAILVVVVVVALVAYLMVRKRKQSPPPENP